MEIIRWNSQGSGLKVSHTCLIKLDVFDVSILKGQYNINKKEYGIKDTVNEDGKVHIVFINENIKELYKEVKEKILDYLFDY
jgi:hypothetical protein